MFSKVIEKKQVAPVQTASSQPTQPQKGVVNLTENLKASSTQQQNFFLSLGGGDLPFDPMDTTILWKYNIPTLVPGQRRRILQIVGLSAVLINYKSAEFPLKLGLEIQGVTGYQSLKWVQPVQGPGGWQTVPTDICGWATARAVNATKDQVLAAYNVSYQIGEQQTWQIGMMNTVTLRLVDSQYNRLNSPFNNPVQLHLRILHLGQ